MAGGYPISRSECRDSVPGGPLVHNFLPAANGSQCWQTKKRRERNRPPSLLAAAQTPGALACVSDAEDGVLDFAWAPDSQSLALVIEPDIDPSLDHIPEDRGTDCFGSVAIQT